MLRTCLDEVNVIRSEDPLLGWLFIRMRGLATRELKFGMTNEFVDGLWRGNAIDIGTPKLG